MICPPALIRIARLASEHAASQDGAAAVEYAGLVAVFGSVGAALASALDIELGSRIAEAIMQQLAAAVGQHPEAR